MALSLDHSAHGHTDSASTTTATLSTDNANDIIIACSLVNLSSLTSISSPNLTWTFLARGGTGALVIELWYAVSTGTLSNEVITATAVGGAYMNIDVFGISGANTASIFDGSAVTGTSDPLSISTTINDTFIIGTYRESVSSIPTQGSGWTKISGTDFQLTEYKIVSSTQSSLSVTQGTGAGTANGGIACAVKIASGGGGRTAMIIPGFFGPMVI